MKFNISVVDVESGKIISAEKSDTKYVDQLDDKAEELANKVAYGLSEGK